MQGDLDGRERFELHKHRSCRLGEEAGQATTIIQISSSPVRKSKAKILQNPKSIIHVKTTQQQTADRGQRLPKGDRRPKSQSLLIPATLRKRKEPKGILRTSISKANAERNRLHELPKETKQETTPHRLRYDRDKAQVEYYAQ